MAREFKGKSLIEQKTKKKPATLTLALAVCHGRNVDDSTVNNVCGIIFITGVA